MTEEAYKNGQVLLIDKPLTWTSFQVVNKLRWEIRQRFNIKKIIYVLNVCCFLIVLHNLFLNILFFLSILGE